MLDTVLSNMKVSELMHAMRENDEDLTLCHFGVKGMKWGHRKQRVTVETANANRRASQAYANNANAKQAYRDAKQAYRDAKKAERQSPEAKAATAAKAKRAAKIGAAVLGTALAAYGTYKLTKMMKDRKVAKAAAAARAADEAWRKSVETAVQNVAYSNANNSHIKSFAAQAGNFAIEYGTRR